MSEPLEDALLAAVAELSPGFRDAASALWHPEHLQRLGDRLTLMQRSGVVDRPHPPFAEETTPPLGPLFDRWRGLLAPPGGQGRPDWVRALAYTLETAGIEELLLLMGMRRTPGSLGGPEAIPPVTPDLLRAAQSPFRDGEALSTAARAWTKHVPRSGEAFWGVIKGAAAEQNRVALSLVRRILKDATWWNVFGHYQQGTVFEARIPTGHGARWQVVGPVFVGFVEPFQAGGIEARESEQ